MVRPRVVSRHLPVKAVHIHRPVALLLQKLRKHQGPCLKLVRVSAVLAPHILREELPVLRQLVHGRLVAGKTDDVIDLVVVPRLADIGYGAVEHHPVHHLHGKVGACGLRTAHAADDLLRVQLSGLLYGIHQKTSL